MSVPTKTAFTEIAKAYRSTGVSSLITKLSVRSVSSNNVTTITTRSMSAFSHMSDNDPEVLEKEKHKELNKRDNKEWNEKLASHSEAVVKADKERDKPIKDLQSETLEHLSKKEQEENNH